MGRSLTPDGVGDDLVFLAERGREGDAAGETLGHQAEARVEVERVECGSQVRQVVRCRHGVCQALVVPKPQRSETRRSSGVKSRKLNVTPMKMMSVITAITCAASLRSRPVCSRLPSESEK